MQLDFRLIGIIISMLIILTLGFDFQSKLTSYNQTYSTITNKLYNFKENIYNQNNFINSILSQTLPNHDKFSHSYKHLKIIKKELLNDKNTKELYPEIYNDFLSLIEKQNNIFTQTENFLIKNSNIKNSQAILFKRYELMKNEDSIYTNNFIRFLISLTSKKQKFEHLNDKDNTALFDYFKNTRNLNQNYNLNFIHLSVLYNELPHLQKMFIDFQNNNLVNELNLLQSRFEEEAKNNKYTLKLNFYLIVSGAIFFFIVILILVKDLKKNLIAVREKDKFIATQARHAAMGEMVDAIAHQWSQPLNVIRMRTDFLTYFDKKMEPEDIKEFQEAVDKQLTHMTDTLHEFRNFLRPSKNAVSFSVKKSIDSVLVLLNDEIIKYTIDLKIIEEQDFNIIGVENEFKHVIINLINNAKDAFIENNIQDKQITISLKTNSITVADNAGGIPQNAIKNIFKANFTTKEEGKGTGIGLYITSQILDKLNATISVKNVNKGACFTINFNQDENTLI